MCAAGCAKAAIEKKQVTELLLLVRAVSLPNVSSAGEVAAIVEHH